MKQFMDTNFLLQSETAQRLYHEHAAKMPIIDYHCHLNPSEIAENHQFADLTEVWLGGDHYKWRQMRANGVPEEYITGTKPAYEKFEKWAGTLQCAMRNPLYHWTHLELSRIFGVDKVLNPSTAREIYDECTAKLQTSEFRAQAIMERMNVEVVCTTDDPIDDLHYHAQIRQSSLKTKVLPAWRPDKAMAIENLETYNDYLTKLEAAADMSILNFKDLIAALQKRYDFFASQGCSLSDHGLTTFYAEPYTDAEIEAMGCMEAFASGLVPIIANSERSATPQFALDDRSLFRPGDSTDLAAKIDWWIEHEDERKRMEKAYAAEADDYRLDKCVARMVEMFRDEMARVRGL